MLRATQSVPDHGTTLKPGLVVELSTKLPVDGGTRNARSPKALRLLTQILPLTFQQFGLLTTQLPPRAAFSSRNPVGK